VLKFAQPQLNMLEQLEEFEWAITNFATVAVAFQGGERRR